MGGGQDLTPLEFFQKLKRICKKHNGYGTCGLCPLYKSDKKPYYLCRNIFYDVMEPYKLDEELIRELIMKVYEIEKD